MERRVEADSHCGSCLQDQLRSSEDASKGGDKVDLFGGITVGQLVGPGLPGGPLSSQCTLRDAATALATLGRSAVAVAGGSGGGLLGLLTENDVMRAYFEGEPPQRLLGDWLHTGLARASPCFLDRLLVRPTESLTAVAHRMVENALQGDCACHHVLVQDGREDEGGGRCAVLSALDLAQALRLVSPATAAQQLTVWDVMKPRDSVFTCLPTDTIRDVLRVLLMSQQNGVLVVDEDGVYGLVTPRDAVRAFADGVPLGMLNADWLRGFQAGVSSRMIACDATVAEAAAMMAARGLDHLVVVRPGGIVAVGMLSSLDLVQAAEGHHPVAHRGLPEAGPTVGELVAQQWHLTAICNRGATLAEAARFLVSSGRTSAAVSLGGDSPPLELLTENDIARAYVDNWSPDFTVERWLLVQESSRPAILPSLMVPPSTRLTEAAALMSSACKPGRGRCHHLVVKGPGLGWDGVFSALDVARGLSALSSELEVARTGADKLKVAMVMKSLDSVPRCQATDTIQQALRLLLRSQDNAVLACHPSTGAPLGLVTARCALEALAEAMPPHTPVAAWLQREHDLGLPREVAPGARLLDAAAMMTEGNLHHLLVKEPSPSAAPVGVLSALDLVRGIASLRSRGPFSTLGWLWSCRGTAACALFAA